MFIYEHLNCGLDITSFINVTLHLVYSVKKKYAQKSYTWFKWNLDPPENIYFPLHF